MYTTKVIKVSLILKFKVKCQGQVIGFVVFEILDLEKVRIDTDILKYIRLLNHKWQTAHVYNQSTSYTKYGPPAQHAG